MSMNQRCFTFAMFEVLIIWYYGQKRTRASDEVLNHTISVVGKFHWTGTIHRWMHRWLQDIFTVYSMKPYHRKSLFRKYWPHLHTTAWLCNKPPLPCLHFDFPVALTHDRRNRRDDLGTSRSSLNRWRHISLSAPLSASSSLSHCVSSLSLLRSKRQAQAHIAQLCIYATVATVISSFLS